MTHSEAIESNAAEGYLLGDLSEAERNAFEEHYIDCRVCSATVREGAAMIAAGREVVQGEKRFRAWNPVTWIPASAAAAAITVVSLYHGIVIPAVQKAASAPVIQAVNQHERPITSAVRSSKDAVAIRFEGKESVQVEAHILDERQFPRYRVELRDNSGKLVETFDRRSDQVKNGVVSMLLSPLPAGRYVLTILGVREDGNRPEVV